jgi:hypothetical protein
VIAAAPRREDAVRAAEEAARRVLIRLAAPDPETDAFLAADGADSPAFPPSAFSIPPELREALYSLPEGTEGAFPSAGPLGLYPFTAFAGSGLADYLGRNAAESLAAVSALTGRTLDTGTEKPALGRGFWRALIRGGYQGGAYYIDRLSREGRA